MSTENAMESSDAFTPDEQAAFDAYRSGQPVPETGSQQQETVPETVSRVPDEETISKDVAETVSDGDDADDEDGIEIVKDANGNARDAKTGKFVPKSAMLRYKDEAKTAKQEAQQLRDNLIAARERLAILTEASQPQQATEPQEEAPPDPEQDIFGYAKWAQKQIIELQKQITTAQTKTQEEFQAYRMKDAFKADISAYRAQKPDFDMAYQHLVNNRDAELQALGFDNQQERQQMLEREAASIVSDAISKGHSPADRLYRLAVARGYQMQAQQTDAQAKAQADLDRIKAGQAAAQSLRGAGSGGAVGEQLTVQKLANMSDEQYATTRSNYIAKNGKAAWVNLTGLP